jgi:hypothetical protein
MDHALYDDELDGLPRAAPDTPDRVPSASTDWPTVGPSPTLARTGWFVGVCVACVIAATLVAHSAGGSVVMTLAIPGLAWVSWDSRRLPRSGYRLAVLATLLGVDLIMIGVVFRIPALLHDFYWQIPAVLSFAGFIRYARARGLSPALGDAVRSTLACAAANSILMTCLSLALFGLHAHKDQELVLTMSVASLVLMGLVLVPFLLMEFWQGHSSPQTGTLGESASATDQADKPGITSKAPTKSAAAGQKRGGGYAGR